MARSKATDVAKAAPAAKSTTMVKRANLAEIDAQILNEVDTIKGNIGAPASNRIALDNKQSKFILPDGRAVEEFHAVVIDFIGANRYYPGAFNRENPVPPACYAFSGSAGTPGTSLANMVPFEDSPEIQSDACVSCPQNVFGSGINGKSKACKNTRDLVLMLVPLDDEPSDDNLYTFQVPPSALRGFDGYISQATKLFGHPIKSTITVRAINMGDFSSVSFDDPEPNRNYGEHFARREEAQPLLFRRPDFTKAPAPARAVAKAKPGRNPAAPRR